jgi:hypothetical protein
VSAEQSRVTQAEVSGGSNTIRDASIENVVKLADAIRYAKYAKAGRYTKYVKVDHARRFAQHVVPEVVRPARVIWNQAIAFVFALLGVYFLGYASTHRQNPAGLTGGIFLGSLMVFFAVVSFLKARKIGSRGIPSKR